MQVHPGIKFESIKGLGVKSDLTIDDIKIHLNEMKQVYDITRVMQPIEMYSYFRSLESAYMNDPTINNFCATVHRLHPVKYAADFRKDGVQELISFLWSLSGMLKCLSCSLSLPIESAYDVHILNKPTTCPICSTTITYETLTIGALRHRWNVNRRYVDPVYLTLYSKFPETLLIPGLKTWKDFCTSLRRAVGRSFTKTDRGIVMRFVRRFADNLSSVSMDLIKGMYRQMDFVNKICCNFEYWNRSDVLNECVNRYNKFMNLIAYKKAMFVPTMDIDLAWHTHQTHVQAYAAYCVAVNKTLIDHDDTIVTNVLNYAYARTFVSWSQRYKEPYSHHRPSAFEWQQGRWLKSILLFPYGVYRMSVWNIYSKPKQLPSNSRDTSEVAIVGTPVMDSTKRPKDEAAFEASLYAALCQIDHTSHAHSSTATGGCSTYYGSYAGCGGGCTAGGCGAGGCGNGGGGGGGGGGGCGGGCGGGGCGGGGGGCGGGGGGCGGCGGG